MIYRLDLSCSLGLYRLYFGILHRMQYMQHIDLVIILLQRPGHLGMLPPGRVPPPPICSGRAGVFYGGHHHFPTNSNPTHRIS